MIHELEEWFDSIRNVLSKMNEEYEEQLSEEICELQKRIDSKSAYSFRKRELESEVKNLKKCEEELRSKIRAAKEERSQQRRIIVERRLECVQSSIDSHRASIHYSFLKAAAEFLLASENPFELTHHELSIVLQSRDRVDKFRRELAEDLANAAGEVSQQPRLFDEVNELKQNICEIIDNINSVRKSLELNHEVQAAVISKIEGFTAAEQVRYREQFLEPKLVDMQTERNWCLPKDVLGLIRGAGERVE